MPKTVQIPAANMDRDPEIVAAENEAYRDYLAITFTGLPLECSNGAGHKPDVRGFCEHCGLVGTRATVKTDPLLEKLRAFKEAASALQDQWVSTSDYGNHPIVTSGFYPFGQYFEDVDDAIATWLEQSEIRAAEAVLGDMAGAR